LGEVKRQVIATMAISDLADRVWELAEDAHTRFNQVFEPVLCLGVTGLSRSSKTVFITSLVANLLERGRLHGLSAKGRISCHSKLLISSSGRALQRSLLAAMV
jgi:predicted YcjX-like family ATPase